MQQLIEAQASEHIGAGRYKRTDERVTERNGYRPRVLSTKAGDLNLKIPKLREGTFFPAVLKPRRRIDQALYAVVMEAYVLGVSTRSVDDLVAALGIDTGISKSQVSRICADLDVRVAAFRNRTLGHTSFVYVYLDAAYVHVRDDALAKSSRGQSWLPPVSAQTADARSSGSTSVTPRTRRSGLRSCGRSRHEGCAVCGS